MKEHQPNIDQQNDEFFDFLRELYPTDNELGFDPNKLEITDEQRQVLIDRREKSDIEMVKAGIKLPPRPRRILREPTQTLAEHIREEFKKRKGDRVGEEISDDEIQNPNSFFRVSLDPANQDMWIGVRVAISSNGRVIGDAKWIHKERQVVLDGILNAESMTGEDAYYIYGPAYDMCGARIAELVRFDDE